MSQGSNKDIRKLEHIASLKSKLFDLAGDQARLILKKSELEAKQQEIAEKMQEVANTVRGEEKRAERLMREIDALEFSDGAVGILAGGR